MGCRGFNCREVVIVVLGVYVDILSNRYAMGIRSVDALRHSGSIEQLNHNQKIGLK